MGVFQFAMTGTAFCTRYANGTILVNIRHMTRFRVVTFLGMTAFVIVAFASYKGD